MGLTELIAGIFKPAAELVDDLHTSKEEKLDAKARLLAVQATVMDTALSYERDTLRARASIVEAEAKSEHWLTSTWRPITMLTMLALTVGDALGILPNPLNEQAWALLHLGLGGYVVGRSVEKVVKEVKK